MNDCREECMLVKPEDLSAVRSGQENRWCLLADSLVPASLRDSVSRK